MEACQQFFDFCEAGKGWEVCKEFAADDGTFCCQAMDALPGPPVSECTTIQQYTDWMSGVVANFGEKATVDVHTKSFDADTDTAMFFATFGGFSHYVYVLKMKDGKISEFTKIWNDAYAGKIACGAEEEQPKVDNKTNAEGAAAEGENAVAAPLEDGTVTLAPYFKLKDVAKFKELWKADYENFGHKEDCVHYAFTFTDNSRAHCREAYKSGEAVIQHIMDVGKVFNSEVGGCIHPDVADLEKLELHGPALELEKVKKWNEEGPKIPFQYFVTEWGFRPAKPAMNDDTVVHLYPYFELENEEHFKKIWKDAYPATKAAAEEEKSHQYAFSFCEDYDSKGKMASCREAYADAASMLLHIMHVGAQFHGNDAETGCIHPDNAGLARLEVHGPAAQLEIIKATEGIKDLPWTYFNTEWGFRNETK